MIKTKFPTMYMLIVAALAITGCTASSTGPKESKKPPVAKNILFISIDDLRPELNSFGAKHIYSPNIDALAAQSRIFRNHFVNAPSCGPSRFSLLTSRYGPTSNDALKFRARALKRNSKDIPPSMPEWFKNQGYKTVSVGKISHYPGGKMGKNWDDPEQLEMPNSWTETIMPVGKWGTPKGMMHGLAHGEIRVNPSDMDVYQSKHGDDNIYPDGLIANAAIEKLEHLTSNTDTPFFLAVGIIRPHLPFGAPRKYLDLYDDVEFPEIAFPLKPQGLSTWTASHELRRYNLWGKDPLHDKEFAQELRRHYAASVSYADAQVGKILTALKESGADKNTIVVLWGDHGWNLGEHAIWGKHNLFEVALRAPLLISYPDIPKPGVATDAVVETTDIFSTLTQLTGLPEPAFAHGQSLVEQVNDPSKNGHAAYSYWRNNHTLREGRFRLTRFGDRGIALYDLNSSEKETKNVANEHPEIVEKMLRVLNGKIKKNDAFN